MNQGKSKKNKLFLCERERERERCPGLHSLPPHLHSWSRGKGSVAPCGRNVSGLQAVPGPRGDGGRQIVQAHLQRCLERRREKVRREQMLGCLCNLAFLSLRYPIRPPTITKSQYAMFLAWHKFSVTFSITKKIHSSETFRNPFSTHYIRSIGFICKCYRMNPNKNMNGLLYSKY